MRLGIIGTGRIGGMLAAAYAKTRLYDLMIINRTSAKADAIQRQHPAQIHVADAMETLIEFADVLFLCLKSTDTRAWLRQWGHLLNETQLLLSTSSQITLHEFDAGTLSLTARVIPSVTQHAHAGIILYTPGAKIREHTKGALHRLLSRVGEPLAIAENDARIYADLTSCGPAFFAMLITQAAAAAADKGVPAATAEAILVATLAGLVRLLKENGLTLSGIIQQVAAPGGVTEAGVALLRNETPRLFADLFAATERRHQEIAAPDNA